MASVTQAIPMTRHGWETPLRILAQGRVTVRRRSATARAARDVPAAGAHPEALARARDDLFERCRHSGTLH